MKNLKVSVIVPIYNAEHYLNQCISSILNQSYRNIELILVNDGSTDKSLSICELYQSDERVNIINKENSGVNKSIACGLEKSDGYYIMFVDSDDWLKENAIEVLVTALEKYDVDAVCCGYTKVNSEIEGIAFHLENRVYDKNAIQSEILNPFYEIDANLYKKWSNPRWDKIYLRHILIKSYYEMDFELVIGEDLEMNLCYLEACENVATISNSYNYCYRVLENSVSRGYTDKMRINYDNLIASLEKLAKKYQRNGLALQKFHDNCIIIMLYELYKTEMKKYPNKVKEMLSLYNTLYNKRNILKIILHLNFPLKNLTKIIYKKLKP